MHAYIHIPFCKQKCTYCAFHKIEASAVPDVFVEKLIQQIQAFYQGRETDSPTSIFFGGGTPSLLTSRQLDQILGAFNLSGTQEITVECNPESLTLEKIKDFRALGVNRLSIGAQSLNHEDLVWMNRIHREVDLQRVLEGVPQFFTNWSLDFIYGRPSQTLQAWAAELRTILSCGMPHVSLYELSLDAGTRLTQDPGLQTGWLSEEARDDMYDLTIQKLAEADLVRYEVSNYARPGFECLYNLAVWRGEPYVGFGPSACGRLKRGDQWIETQNPALEAWLQKPEWVGKTVMQRLTEILMTSLRTREGLTEHLLQDALGMHLIDVPRLDFLIAHPEWATVTKESVKLSTEGLRILDFILAEIC